MAEFGRTIPAYTVPVSSRALFPAVADYCRQLFPHETREAPDAHRVTADAYLGDWVRAHLEMSVKPVRNDPGSALVSMRMRIMGPKVTESDRVACEAMIEDVVDGFERVIRTVMERPHPDFGRGVE